MDNNDILKQLSAPLNIEDVDFRIQSINNGGFATILAYKDARVDMNRLDAVCGPNWQKEYKYIENKGLLFCRVGIKINDEWIWREDLGAESFSDKEKGQASDAFKRACFNWGIGRELYDYPVIQVKLNADEFTITDGPNNKKIVKQTWNLKLKNWVWTAEFDDKGRIKKLTAKDENGKLRYDSTSIQSSNQQQSPSSQSTPQNNNSQAATGNKELKWLNIMDKDKNFTKEWTNIVKAINEKRITSVSQVRDHYKVSKEVEAKINETLNY